MQRCKPMCACSFAPLKEKTPYNRGYVSDRFIVIPVPMCTPRLAKSGFCVALPLLCYQCVRCVCKTRHKIEMYCVACRHHSAARVASMSQSCNFPSSSSWCVEVLVLGELGGCVRSQRLSNIVSRAAWWWLCGDAQGPCVCTHLCTHVHDFRL